MKKFISVILSLVFIFALCPKAGAQSAAPELSAKSAILIHADSGEVLYEKCADDEMLIASTTKLMTALVVLQNCEPQEEVEIQTEYTLVEGSSMYLKAGEKYTVEELLYGLMLASGNDAALALACHTAGSVEDFAALMNEKAKELGLEHSSFKNPHGLDAEGHYSSARDLAKIMQKAMENELFRTIMSTRVFTCREQTYVNHNKLLWNCDGVIAGKTGYTMAAGRSLVSCCEREGMRLICVTLSDPKDWDDHTALYNWGYSSYEYTDPLGSFAKISLPVVSGESQRVTVSRDGDGRVFRRRDSNVRLLLEMPRFVFAPVSEGDRAGKVKVYVDEELADELELCYVENINIDEGAALTRWERFKRIWYMSMRYSGYIPQQ